MFRFGRVGRQNEIEVSHRLRQRMEEMRASLPDHIDMQLAFDATNSWRMRSRRSPRPGGDDLYRWVCGLSLPGIITNLHRPLGGHARIASGCGPGDVDDGFLAQLAHTVAIVLSVGGGG